MLKIKLLYLIITASLTHSFGQAGFLGSLNSLEGNILLVPSLKRTNTMELEGERVILNKRLRIVNPSYSINYSRILSRQIELSLGFGFSRQRSFQILTYPVVFESENSSGHLLMEDLIVNQKGLNFEIRKYVKGSIAPIGKFMGVNFSASQTSLKKNQELIYADFFKIDESNFFSKKMEVENLVFGDTLSDQSMSGFTISFIYGSNRIIAKNLLFNYSVVMPILSAQRTENNLVRGLFEYKGGNGYIEDYDLTPTLFNTYRKYNGIRLQIGVKYFF